MSTPAPPPEDEQGRRVAAAAAGGTLAVGYVAAAGTPEVDPARRAAAVGAILASVVGFLADQRERAATFLRTKMAGRGPVDDIASIVAEEQNREAQFAEKQTARIARDITTALSLPGQTEREIAVRAVMDREDRYARQRVGAQAARAFAAIDRVALRTLSPSGAFWRLDPDVNEHTAGCLLMGGKFWPWTVLDRVHPPRHPGCPCKLVSYAEAIAGGELKPGDVMDVRAAVKRAAMVIMEAQIYAAPDANREELRDLLFESYVIEQEDVAMDHGLLTRGQVDELRESLVIGIEKPPELAESTAGLGRDHAGFFLYGLRTRSASFKVPADIPAQVVATFELAA